MQHRFASWHTTTNLISHHKTITAISNAVSYEIFVVVSLTKFSLLCFFFYIFSLKQSTSFWTIKRIPELLTGLCWLGYQTSKHQSFLYPKLLSFLDRKNDKSYLFLSKFSVTGYYSLIYDVFFYILPNKYVNKVRKFPIVRQTINRSVLLELLVVRLIRNTHWPT